MSALNTCPKLYSGSSLVVVLLFIYAGIAKYAGGKAISSLEPTPMLQKYSVIFLLLNIFPIFKLGSQYTTFLRTSPKAESPYTYSSPDLSFIN